MSREISIAIFVGFAIFALLIGFAWGDGSAVAHAKARSGSATAPAKDGSATAPAKDGSAIAHAKAIVQNNLYDPSSAQFKDMEVIGSGNNITICGNVNAKNKFGEYIGYTPFIYRRGERSYSVVIAQDRNRSDVETGCLQAKLDEANKRLPRLEAK